MVLLGIDEAGRGPVIGPLVIAGVLISKDDEPKLKSLGVKDSKLLTPLKREKLFDKIIELAKSTRIIIVEPKEIDEIMNSVNLNLNKLEALKSALIINEFNPPTVILDCPSPNKKAYADYLKIYLKNKDIEIIAEHKADQKYPVVAAASILAKVTRDREIAKLELKYGKIGPGYQSNPITQKFIEENWEKHPEIFRKTWLTYKNHVNKKAQKKLGDF
jgi:ribonuclease HII